MARLTLLDSKRHTPNTPVPAAAARHRGSATEGESVHKLLESNGFALRRKSSSQLEFSCPFHEEPGVKTKSTNFYVNATSGLYTCHSAACGERGNLQSLERYFGVDQDDTWQQQYLSREQQLTDFETCLTPALRRPFYDRGLTDQTIERFRLGWDQEKQRYVIPYLDGRRPRYFRYYQPNGDPKYKYTWEEGATASLFNFQDAMGDKDGVVLLTEGEGKAMLLVQLGYAAVAVPGAGQWKDEFQAAFTHARKIFLVYDNDNPAFHVYDRDDHRCVKCERAGLEACKGHNPGQEAAVARVEQLGWRAKNVLLPLPDEGLKKTDVNDYFMRDGNTNADFAELVTGKRATPFKVSTFAEISAAPPEEAHFLVEQGILPKGGRLLIAGKPKVGKSICVDNLALSLAAGIPFLGRFKVDHPTRTLLLDRELSKWSLFKRLQQLSQDRPGYRAAAENLLIDHDHLLRLDQPNAYETLKQLVEQNGAEVVILDTAYKFLGGDVESSSALMKAFAVLDKVLHETGVSIVLTHHLKKGQGGKGKENTDVADPDAVAGSFLWTGWPNATILLNYLNRSVENPFNSVATFTAFRDHAAPEPLALYRDRTSISYSAIQDFSHDGEAPASTAIPDRISTEGVAQLLLDVTPCTEDEFFRAAVQRFGCSEHSVKPFFLDALSQGHFERTSGHPPVIKLAGQEEVETWEKEHGLAERPVPEGTLDLEELA